MVFSASVLGLKNANARAPCLFCLAIGDQRGKLDHHKSAPTRPIHEDDEAVREWEAKHNGETFEFDPTLGYKGTHALTINAKQLAIEYLHFRLNVYKRVISHIALMAKRYSSISSLNEYINNSIKGLNMNLEWNGKKISITPLKENQIDLLFSYQHTFEKVFPHELGLHLNQIFSTLASMVQQCKSSIPIPPSQTSNPPNLGQTLLQLLLHSVPGYAPLFTPAQITPYLHVACAHLEDVNKRLGPISKFSSSIIEAVNHDQVKRYLNNTMKGGGRLRENPWTFVIYRELLLALHKKQSSFTPKQLIWFALCLCFLLVLVY